MRELTPHVDAIAPVDRLNTARAAWVEMLAAEAQMQRLRSYTHLSRTMRDDLSKWSSRYGEARAKLSALLGPMA